MSARRSIRKLVSLTPDLASAVERVRQAGNIPGQCPTCGGKVEKHGAPNESDTLRYLIELGLDYHERKAGQ